MSSLKKQNLDYNEIEDSLVTSIFWVEHETGHMVNEEYPWFKFLEEVKEVSKYLEQKSKSMEGI